jgi:solute carrier family 35 protein C2
MDRSHRRSASTATTSLNDSALKTRRPVTRTDTSDLVVSHESIKTEDAASEASDMTSSDDFELDDILSDDGLEDDEETGLTSTDRRKRRKRKRRATMLDERVAPSLDTRQAEMRLASRSFWSAFIMNAVFILLWYLFSIAITVVSFLDLDHTLYRNRH